jgi:hypothetical protein
MDYLANAALRHVVRHIRHYHVSKTRHGEA